MPDGDPDTLGEDAPLRLLELLSSLNARLLPFVRAVVHEPSPSSPWKRELQRNSAAVRTVLVGIPERAIVALSVCVAAAGGVSRLLVPPMVFSAPGVVARTAVEAAGTGLWLLEPTLTGRVRAKRGLLLLSADLGQERRLAESNLRSQPVEYNDVLAAAVAWVADETARIEVLTAEFLVESKFAKLGSAANPTTLATKLGLEFEYRLWSNHSHGTPFALRAERSLAYGSDDGAGAVFLHPAITVLLCASRLAAAIVDFVCPERAIELRAMLEEAHKECGVLSPFD